MSWKKTRRLTPNSWIHLATIPSYDRVIHSFTRYAVQTQVHVAVAVRLAQEVGLGNVRVLVDFYHMVCEKESPDILRRYGAEYLCHVHFSCPAIPEIDGVRDPARISRLYEGELARRGWWRTYPSSPDEWDYGAFVQAVKDCGYDGRVSLEAPAPAFARQAGEALDVLHTLFG